MPIATFDTDLKKIIPFFDPCLLAVKDIPNISQEYTLYTYHPRLFRKIKKRFGLWSIGGENNIMNPHICIKDEFSLFNQSMLQLTRLMVPPANCLVWSRRKISLKKPVHFWRCVLRSYIFGKKKSLPKYLIPLPRFYQFWSRFYPRLK